MALTIPSITPGATLVSEGTTTLLLAVPVKGTASDFTSANPVLAASRIGYETDTAKIKFGDGSTAWNSLAYFEGTGGGGVGATTGSGAPASTPSAEGAIYIDTTADTFYIATGSASSADWQQVLLHEDLQAAIEAGDSAFCEALRDAVLSVDSPQVLTDDDTEGAAEALALVGIFLANATRATSMRFAEDTDNGSNYAEVTAPTSIASNVTLTLPVTTGTLGLTNKGKHSIWVPAGAMVPRTTSGAGTGTLETTTNKVMADYLAFDTAADEFAQFSLQMPKSWNEGTLVAQFIWTHPSTTTNFDVTWAIQAVAFANDDALDTAFGTAVVVSDAGGTTNDVYFSAETSAFTVAGTPGAEELVVFQVYRDVDGNGTAGNDDLAVDAYLLGVKIHYTTDAETDD